MAELWERVSGGNERNWKGVLGEGTREPVEDGGGWRWGLRRGCCGKSVLVDRESRVQRECCRERGQKVILESPGRLTGRTQSRPCSVLQGSHTTIGGQHSTRYRCDLSNFQGLTFIRRRPTRAGTAIRYVA